MDTASPVPPLRPVPGERQGQSAARSSVEGSFSVACIPGPPARFRRAGSWAKKGRVYNLGTVARPQSFLLLELHLTVQLLARGKLGLEG